MRVPILQMWKGKSNNVKSLSHGHTTPKWQSCYLSSGVLALKYLGFPWTRSPLLKHENSDPRGTLVIKISSHEISNERKSFSSKYFFFFNIIPPPSPDLLSSLCSSTSHYLIYFLWYYWCVSVAFLPSHSLRTGFLCVWLFYFGQAPRTLISRL